MVRFQIIEEGVHPDDRTAEAERKAEAEKQAQEAKKLEAQRQAEAQKKAKEAREAEQRRKEEAERKKIAEAAAKAKAAAEAEARAAVEARAAAEAKAAKEAAEAVAAEGAEAKAAAATETKHQEKDAANQRSEPGKDSQEAECLTEEKNILKRAEAEKERGNLAFKENRMDDAVRYFTTAISLSQNHVYYSNRSNAYFSLNLYHESLADAEKCLQLSPGFTKALYRKGLCHLELGQLDDAIKALSEGLQLAPQSVQIRDCLRRAHFRKQQQDVLAKAAAEAAKPKPELAPLSPEQAAAAAAAAVPVSEPTVEMTPERAAAIAKKEKEEQELFLAMESDWKASTKRCQALAGRTVEQAATRDCSALESEVQRLKEIEDTRKKQEAAKFRALAQHMDYEGFRQLVAGAQLKPMARNESVWTAAEGPVVLNSAAETTRAPAPAATVAGTDGKPAVSGVRTHVQFEKQWRALGHRKDDAGRFRLLQELDPLHIRKVFGTEIDSDLLLAIFANVDAHVSDTASVSAEEFGGVVRALRALGESPRLSLTLKFLSKTELDQVTSLLDKLSNLSRSKEMEEVTQASLGTGGIEALRAKFCP